MSQSPYISETLCAKDHERFVLCPLAHQRLDTSFNGWDWYDGFVCVGMAKQTRSNRLRSRSDVTNVPVLRRWTHERCAKGA